MSHVCTNAVPPFLQKLNPSFDKKKIKQNPKKPLKNDTESIISKISEVQSFVLFLARKSSKCVCAQLNPVDLNLLGRARRKNSIKG